GFVQEKAGLESWSPPRTLRAPVQSKPPFVTRQQGSSNHRANPDNARQTSVFSGRITFLESHEPRAAFTFVNKAHAATAMRQPLRAGNHHAREFRNSKNPCGI